MPEKLPGVVITPILPASAAEVEINVNTPLPAPSASKADVGSGNDSVPVRLAVVFKDTVPEVLEIVTLLKLVVDVPEMDCIVPLKSTVPLLWLKTPVLVKSPPTWMVAVPDVSVPVMVSTLKLEADVPDMVVVPLNSTVPEVGLKPVKAPVVPVLLFTQFPLTEMVDNAGDEAMPDAVVPLSERLAYCVALIVWFVMPL